MEWFTTKVDSLNNLAPELNRLESLGHTIFSLKLIDGKIVIGSFTGEMQEGGTQVNVVGSVLPTGAATSVLQTDGNTSLSNIDSKLPQLSSGRVPVDIGGNGSITVTSGTITVQNEVEINNDVGNPIPVSASSLPLPTGAATAVNQTNGTQKSQLVDANGDVAEIKSLSTALDSSDKAIITHSVIQGLSSAGGGSFVDVKVTPSGAITTESEISGFDAAALGQKVMANSLSVTVASDQTIIPVTPSMVSGGNISVTTAAVGTNYTAFASQALKQLTVSNQTGTTIEFRQDGAGVGFQIPVGTIFTFFGLTNANQIEAKRVDNSNTQLTITARWES